jgi:hypothetical protein
MSNTAENIEPQATDYLRPHNPQASGLGEVWGCMEDRPVGTDGLRLFQSAGGAKGIALDTVVALEMQQPGTILDTDRFNGGYTSEPVGAPPTYVIAGQVATAAAKNGVELSLHEQCAGEISSPEITLAIANPDNRGRLWERSREMLPDLDSSEFETIIEISEALLAQARIADPTLAAKYLEAGFEWQGMTYPPIARLPLRYNVAHQAGLILATHTPYTAFATSEAFGTPEALNVPAYNVSFGDMNKLSGTAAELFNVDPRPLHRSFLAAAAVRHAAIADILPLPPGQTSMRIQCVA